MINSEQIQALRAAAEKAKLSQRRGGMEMAADSYDFIAMTTPQFILSLLEERDADKALIAEQAKRIAELEAHKLTVKLPTAYDLTGETDGNCSLNDASMKPDVGGCYFRRRDVEQACAAAGITLVVEE
nr:MAG TPA: Ead/Ea22-like protein [Caudoviricetes sp.]